MKITCQSCGKKYDTDQDELCPNCGSYNPITRETADPDGSYAEEQQYYQDQSRYSRRTEQNENHSYKEPSREEKKKILYREKERTVLLQQKEKKGGCLGAILGRLVAFCVVLIVVQQCSEFARVVIGQRLEEQMSAAQISVSEYEMNDSFVLDNGTTLSVSGVQTLEISEEWKTILNEYREIPEGMQIKAVFLDLQIPGELLTNESGQTAYLKRNQHVYRPLYSWQIEQEVCEQIGAWPLSGYGEEEAGLKGILFLVPKEEEITEELFCIQQSSTIPVVEVEKVDSRIQVRLEGEE